MTKDEWAELVEQMVAWWPNFDWRKATQSGSLDAWFDDVAEFDAEQVGTAAASLYREGHDWPRNGAQIRKRVIELSSDVPTWGQVWERLWQAAQRFGQRREEEALEWLAEWSPLAAEFARRLPYREFCVTEEPEVFHGQARRIWEQTTARAERDSSLQGLPSAGLRAVERANDGPAQIGNVFARSLPSGKDAA